MINRPPRLTLLETPTYATLGEFLEEFRTAVVEHFGVIFHGPQGRESVVGFAMISSGSCWKIKNISMEKILDEAEYFDAKGMTLVHNHPSSGALRPSVEDLRTTYRIHDIAKKSGVPVLDHIIYGVDNAEFSFVENGIDI